MYHWGCLKEMSNNIDSNINSMSLFWHTTVLLKEVCPILNDARSVIKLRKWLNIYWSHVSSLGKYGMTFYIRSACLQDLSPSLTTTPLMHGGQAQILGLMNRLKKVSIPSSFWELGSFGITAIAVFDGIQSSLNSVLVLDEFLLWSLTGARGISNLLALEPANAWVPL
jgi:hypothetical protein